MSVKVLCIVIGLCVIVIGCAAEAAPDLDGAIGGESSAGGGYERIQRMEARIAALERQIAALREGMADGNGSGAQVDAAAVGASANVRSDYITLSFLLKEFAARPVGGRAEIGQFLGVYGGSVVLCGNEPYESPFIERAAGFGSSKHYAILQTKRLKSNGERGQAEWTYQPARFGDVAHCLRRR